MKFIKRGMAFVLSTAMLMSAIPVWAAENTAPDAPTGLLTNELEHPLNVENPTFGWLVQDSDYNEIQTAYEIVVTDEINGEVIWDSGKVESSEQSYVEYEGEELKDGYPYSWKVKTWDKDGAESPYSEVAYFATGIDDENWNASWISDGSGGASASTGKFNHYWYTRHEASLDSEKTVAKATAYFAAVHDYNLYVNGVEIGRGQSFDHASETRYQGWDITEAVKSSADALTVGALVRTYGPAQGRVAGDAGILGQINVYYTDGSVQTVSTNGEWKVSATTPFSGTTKRNGEGEFVEYYDIQKSQDGFATADFDDSSWTAATVAGAHPTATMTAVHPELSCPTSDIVYPVSVTKLSDGTTLADFGKVIPARPQITFKNGTAGKQYKIIAGYVLNEDGTINTSDRASQSTDMSFVYTQKDGEQTYNAWDHLAFRYLSIPSCDEEFTTETIAAKLVHTNVPEGRESTFTSSNEMLDNVYELMKRSSLYSIQNQFVDTPTREKGQFLQDSINISEAATVSNYERAVSKKAMEQFLASADRYWTGDEAGRFNSVYPNGDGKRDIPDFSLNVPYWVWTYYMTTGDKALLEKAYPYIRATADYITKYTASNGLVTQLAGGDSSANNYQYGIIDWPAVGRFGYDWSGTKTGARTTVNMLSKRAFDMIANAAEALGYTDDAAEMKSRSAAITQAINENLINADGVYCDGLDSSGSQVSHASQHATSYALAFDIAPEESREMMSDYVAAMGMKQGPMTADILVKALFDSEENAAALKLFTEPQDNGWAKEVANGYTFTWEAWNAGDLSDEISQSHGWGSAAVADMLENFTGVQNIEAGASKIRIAPIYTDLTSLDSSVWTQRGKVDVAYERTEASYDINITVPANVTAEIVLPVIGNGSFVEKNGNAGEGTVSDKVQTFNVGSGSYEFTYDGDITVLPEAVVYDPTLDTDTYSLVSLYSEEFNTEHKGQSKEYKYNDLLSLYFGTGSTSISSTNGMDLYNDGSYVKFTPNRTGKISLDVKMRKANSGNAASTLYMSTTAPTNGGTSICNTVSSDTELTIKDIEVEAGVTYYLYNSAGRPTSIKNILYSYPQDGEVIVPTTAPTNTPTIAPTSAPTTAPTPFPTVKSVDKYMHISFDDVYSCLKDITNNNYTSVFENSFFADLKSLHDEYGAVFTLNCFNTYSGDSSYDISNLPDRYAAELAENADWLKFAFHAENNKSTYGETTATSSGVLATAEESTASYNKFVSAILKATGTDESIDTVTRLGFFSGNSENVEAMKNCEYGITGLLAADDTRVSYYFDDALNNYIIANNDYYDTDKDLRLIRSQTRLESVKNTSETLNGLSAYSGNILEIFTHEASYKDNVPNRLKAYVEWAANNGYGFAYAMDVQGELIKITSKTESENEIDYSLQINAGNNVTVIATSYDADGTLYSVNTSEVADNAANVSVTVPEGDFEVKFMLWDSLKGMKPVSLAVSDSVIADDTNPDDTTPDIAESEIITLNKTNYPLVVGNKSKTDFSDWETRGSSVQLTATVTDDTYSASDITWESANSSIATVTSTGKVRGRTTGVTRVYACLPNGEKESCDITVIDNVTRLTVQAIEFNTDELTLAKDTTATLIPVIYPKDTFNNGVLNTALTWSSSDEAVATVENGVITAKSNGTAVIKAVSADVGRTAECIVTVADGIVSETVTGDEDVTEMTVGETAQLIAECDGDIIWTSENSYVAEVDENGKVTAYSNSRVPRVGENGQTVFENGRTVYDDSTVNIIATAKNGGMTKVFPVKVTENERVAFSVAMNVDSMSIASGTTAEITAAVLPSNMMDKTVTWSTSDETVATVTDSGRTVYGVCKADITAKAAGTATVTAECDGREAVCEVTVTDGEVKVSDIEINNAKSLDIDEVCELTASVNKDANNKKLAWVSTDRDILTVNNEGTLKGYKAGTVKVYAIALDSVSDSALLEEVLDTRTLGDNNEKLNTLLTDSVYAETEITVKDSSPYLRNLHAPVEAITDNSINLLWNRASLIDTGDWKEYEVYCNGKKLDTVETLGYTAKNLDADTEYKFEISAVDANGTELISEEITVKTKPQSEVVNVLDYGAKGNGKVMDTYAIQKAIDECPENGTVLLPKGYTFYSGALFLKSNMTFKVDGVLMGSPYGKDYPMVITRWEGWRKLYQTADEWANTTDSLPENHHPYASLINAGTYDEGENSYNGPYHTENIVICGEGQINANGFTLGYNEGLNQKTGNGGWPEPMSPAMDQTVRGRAITIHNAKNVYMKDVTVAYAPSWTIHPIYCKNLTFGDMYVVSKGDGETGAADDICILNGDGINPDSSVNANIFNIEFVTGDDAVAIKSGRNKEGNDLDKPSEYIRVTDCTSIGSKGGFVAGSENASGLRESLFQNLYVADIMLSHSIWLKTYWSRGGLTENVIFRDIDSTKRIDIAANYSTSENNPADELPIYRYLTFENCTPSFVFEGLEASGGREATYVQYVTLRGCPNSGDISYGKNFEIWDSYESRWDLSHTENIVFKYSNQDSSTDIKVKDGAQYVSAVNLENKTITATLGATAEQVLADIESLIPNTNLTYELNNDATSLTVTSQDGLNSVSYSILYAQVWDFAQYTTEVSTTESGFTESYDGLTIAIANNGADSDHDKITTSGVYWRGGASSGETTRYIEYTPTVDGTLMVTGKLNSNGGRWGISASKEVSSFVADESSSTSTSTTTVQMKCTAGTTYYIFPKARSATVNTVSYIPE